jgi:hypothetical protein
LGRILANGQMTSQMPFLNLSTLPRDKFSSVLLGLTPA